MKYKYVIWDIDGTLLDTREGLIFAYKWTFEQLKINPLSNEEILHLIGPTPVTIFKEKFGLNDDKAQQAGDLFRERYKNYDLYKAKLYDGILDVLKILSANGVKQAIATNKRQDYAMLICQYFGIDKYCSPIYGADNGNQLTKNKLILATLSDMNADFSQSIMIGDTIGDRKAAEEANINFIGVNYGFGFKNIEGYVNSPLEILDKLDTELGV